MNLHGVDRSAKSTSRQAPRACQGMCKTQQRHCERWSVATVLVLYKIHTKHMTSIPRELHFLKLDLLKRRHEDFQKWTWYKILQSRNSVSRTRLWHGRDNRPYCINETAASDAIFIAENDVALVPIVRLLLIKSGTHTHTIRTRTHTHAHTHAHASTRTQTRLISLPCHNSRHTHTTTHPHAICQSTVP